METVKIRKGDIQSLFEFIENTNNEIKICKYIFNDEVTRTFVKLELAKDVLAVYCDMQDIPDDETNLLLPKHLILLFVCNVCTKELNICNKCMFSDLFNAKNYFGNYKILNYQDIINSVVDKMLEIIKNNDNKLFDIKEFYRKAKNEYKENPELNPTSVFERFVKAENIDTDILDDIDILIESYDNKNNEESIKTAYDKVYQFTEEKIRNICRKDLPSFVYSDDYYKKIICYLENKEEYCIKIAEKELTSEIFIKSILKNEYKTHLEYKKLKKDIDAIAKRSLYQMLIKNILKNKYKILQAYKYLMDDKDDFTEMYLNQMFRKEKINNDYFNMTISLCDHSISFDYEISHLFYNLLRQNEGLAICHVFDDDQINVEEFLKKHNIEKLLKIENKLDYYTETDNEIPFSCITEIKCNDEIIFSSCCNHD